MTIYVFAGLPTSSWLVSQGFPLFGLGSRAECTHYPFILRMASGSLSGKVYFLSSRGPLIYMQKFPAGFQASSPNAGCLSCITLSVDFLSILHPVLESDRSCVFICEMITEVRSLNAERFMWKQVAEVQIGDKLLRSEVQIEKCRYLETSGCTGMCVNLCKVPTQYFFTSELGYVHSADVNHVWTILNLITLFRMNQKSTWVCA